MIDRGNVLPLTRQASLLRLSRSSVYYLPRPVPPARLAIMHRIDALQAYAACEVHAHSEHEATDHGGLVLVCSRCKQLTEFEDDTLEHQIERAASRRGFHVAHRLIEIRGLCGRCAAAA